jgi:hypothetical protein
MELVVVRDKFTHESKGSAFVWYRTKADADRACAQLNLRRGLPEPGSGQERPLVVRRANTRRPAAPLGLGPYPAGGLSAGPGVATAAGAAPPHHHHLFGAGPPPPQLLPAGLVGAPPGGGPPRAPTGVVSYEALGLAPPPALTDYPAAAGALQLQPVMLQAAGPMGGGGLAAGGGGQIVYQPVIYAGGSFLAGGGPQDCIPVSSGTNALSVGPPGGVFSAASTLTSSAGNTLSGNLMSGAATSGFMSCAPPPLALEREPPLPGGGGGPGGRGGSAGGSGGAGGAADGPVVAVQIPVGAGQMAAMTEHIYSIQMMSGADVTSQAVGPGLFYILIQGARPQVDVAHQMLASVLQSLQ